MMEGGLEEELADAEETSVGSSEGNIPCVVDSEKCSLSSSLKAVLAATYACSQTGTEPRLLALANTQPRT